MPETLSPDAIVSSLNMTGVVGNIQDDPDSPDANWVVADSTANCQLAVSFGTPSNTLEGDQEFRVLLRRIAPTGGNNPGAKLILQSAGVDAGTTASVSLAAATTVFSHAWNVSDLSDPSGATVGLAVRILRSGGSGANRRVADVGAIEWNASVAAAGGTYNAVPTILHNFRNMGN